MSGNDISLATLTANARQREDREFRAAFPASLDCLERAIAGFREQLRSILRFRGFFVAELLLREALTNAVLHGSRKRSGLMVRCIVRVNSRRLLIAVKDEGPGFDWRSARQLRAGVSDCSGRGLEIYRNYACRVRFNSPGNAVIMQRFFKNRS